MPRAPNPPWCPRRQSDDASSASKD